MTDRDWIFILSLVEAVHMHYATLYHSDGKDCRICDAILVIRRELK